MIKFNDQLKINRSEWILGCSNYCQATWKQKHKTKINQETIIKNNKKIKKKKKNKSNEKYNTYHGPLSKNE